METEKERRLKELPKIRPADQIDITPEQLELIHDIYIAQPKVGEAVSAVTFFMAVRKHPEIRLISSAIARDPEGCARLHKESFQQVFDRMEKDTQAKTIEWATIVEYFTKRGRPLTQEEINKLVEEDRRLREEEEEFKRKTEEEERRRLARIMENADGKENGDDDFDKDNDDNKREDDLYDDEDDYDDLDSVDDDYDSEESPQEEDFDTREEYLIEREDYLNRKRKRERQLESDYPENKWNKKAQLKELREAAREDPEF